MASAVTEPSIVVNQHALFECIRHEEKEQLAGAIFATESVPVAVEDHQPVNDTFFKPHSSLEVITHERAVGTSLCHDPVGFQLNDLPGRLDGVRVKVNR